MILISGATGSTGGATARQLLKEGHPIRALAHREDDRSKLLQDLGAEGVYGDLLDIQAVTAAFGGVCAALFVGSPLRPEMVKTSAIFGLVAKEAGVEIVVSTSMLPSRRDTKSPVLMDHWLSERVLDFAGIPITHLRAGLFSEWLFYVSHLIRPGPVRDAVAGRGSPRAGHPRGLGSTYRADLNEACGARRKDLHAGRASLVQLPRDRRCPRPGPGKEPAVRTTSGR